MVAEIQKTFKRRNQKGYLPTERKDSLIKEIEGEDDRDNLETLRIVIESWKIPQKKINEELNHQKRN